MESNEIRTSDEIDLIQVLAPLTARWKLLLVIGFLGCVGGFLYSRTLPRIYASSATIYVQQAQGAAGLLRNLPVSLGSSSGGTSYGYILTLLRSESLRNLAIKNLNLLDNQKFTYGEKLTDIQALGRLSKMVSVLDGKDGSIALGAETRDPELAANIVNTMVDGLGKLVQTASTRKANFIEHKLNTTSNDLARAEEEMSKFMETHDVTMIDEQTKGMIQQLGELDIRLLDLDAKLQSLDSNLTNEGDLNRLVDKEVERKSLEQSRNYIAGERDKLKAQLDKLPEVGTQYVRIQRKITVLGKTFELLTEQYQLARITQKGEDGDYQVIDRAWPNLRKVAPKTIPICLMGGIAADALAIVIIFLLDRSRRTKRDRRPARSRTATTGAVPTKRG